MRDQCQHGHTLRQECAACATIPGDLWAAHPVPTSADAMALAPIFASGLRAEAKRRRALSGQTDAPGNVIVVPDRTSVPPPSHASLDTVDCVWPAEVEPSAWLEMIDYRWVQRRYPGGYVLRWRIAGSGGAMTTSDYEWARGLMGRSTT